MVRDINAAVFGTSCESFPHRSPLSHNVDIHLLLQMLAINSLFKLKITEPLTTATYSKEERVVVVRLKSGDEAKRVRVILNPKA